MRMLVKDLYMILQEELGKNNGDLPVECLQQGKHRTLYFHITNWGERQRVAFDNYDPLLHRDELPAFTLELTPGKNIAD